MKHFLLLTVLCSLFIAVSGCDSDKRLPISGEITLNGEPLPGANIEFVPADQTVLNTRSGVITDKTGKFTLPKTRGLEPGEYVVQIYATVEFDKRTKELVTPETPEGAIYSKVLTPPEYNNKSTLRFNVSEKETNVFKCDVKSKATRKFGQD